MVSPLFRRAVDPSPPLLDHLSALPVAIIETDGDGILQTWAGAAERLFGWSAEEVLGTDIDALELVHDADLAFVDAVIDRLRGGHEHHLVHRNRNRTRSGEIRHCEWTRILLGTRSGRRPALLSLAVDVTAQFDAEQSALTACAELEHWLRANPEACLGVDRAWRITHWNPAAERMLERTRAEAMGRDLWEAFPEFRDTTFHRAFEEAVADGHLRILEDRAPRGGLWFSVTAVPSAQGLNVFISNVTGRRQLEQEVLRLDAAVKRARRPEGSG
jgi:PAS domain S-box-containing protein